MARPRKNQNKFGNIPPEAWQMVFQTGYDYLGELAPYGILTEQEAQAAALAAWSHYRQEFMAAWRAHPQQLLPWVAIVANDNAKQAG